MTTEKEDRDLFNAQLIAEKNIDGVIFQLYSNRIFYVKVPRYEKIDMKIVNEGYKFLDENGGGKFFNIYHFRSFSDVEPETRKWAADPSGNHYTHTDAIVIGNVGQKIITDFYLRFDKPIVPTKIFFSVEQAIAWTEKQFDQFDSTN